MKSFIFTAGLLPLLAFGMPKINPNNKPPMFATHSGDACDGHVNLISHPSEGACINTPA